MKNKFFRAFLIVLSVEVLLILYAFFFNSWSFEIFGKSISITFPSYKEIINPVHVENNDLADKLIDSYLNDSTKLSTNNDKNQFNPSDTIVDTLLTNDPINGIRPLESFFKSLREDTDSTIIRIGHYGDSQLEGNRITIYLRKSFQEKFGGKGVGFVPFTELADNISYGRYPSRNWVRYTVFHNQYKNGYYGLSGTLFKYIRCVTDTISADSIKNTANPYDTIRHTYFDRGTLTLKMSKDPNYTKVKLMCGRVEKTMKINVYDNTTGVSILSDTIKSLKNFNIKTLKLKSRPYNIKFEFIADDCPEIYGLFFDGDTGVQVDNYAIRGHSGDGLLKINPDFLATQIKQMNVKLVIFQFGANAIPYIKSDAAVKYIEDSFYKLFSTFKKNNPQLSILVIGVGDMAYRKEGVYSSYAYIPKIREAQKRAATNAGCAYWDLLDAMGGPRSITSWNRKKLASFDGHFSPKGQEIVGNALFKSLDIEYQKYLNNYKNSK